MGCSGPAGQGGGNSASEGSQDAQASAGQENPGSKQAEESLGSAGSTPKSSQKSPDADEPSGESGSDPSQEESSPEPKGSADPKEGLAGLPAEPEEPISHGVFHTSRDCEDCHVYDSGVLVSSSGQSVSPPKLWGSSMMAFAARDPYWLAQYSVELELYPQAKEEISDKCSRCHAPALNDARRRDQKAIRFEDFTSSTSDLAHLGREGVTCTVCHQISPRSLGPSEELTGAFEIGQERKIWGPHKEPLARPMQTALGYTPTASDHMLASEHCATCHTVFTKALDEKGRATGPAFPEQATYLEWKNSSSAKNQQSCQSCHASRIGRDGKEFTTVLSILPPSLNTQREVGDHGFLGGNAYMLELMADNREWAGIRVDKHEIVDTAAQSLKFLQGAVILSLKQDGKKDAVALRLQNLVGHKFPSGYPTRRAWVELIAYDGGGKVLFHSGRTDKAGRIRGKKGEDPHYQRITSQEQTQIYESIMQSAAGETTHSLLAAVKWSKDNRLLPRGWSAEHSDAKWTTPVGTQKDSDFKAGQDVVFYDLPKESKRVVAKLWYQSVPPSSVQNFKKHLTPAGKSFVAMLHNKPPLPKLVASAELDL